jgi:hypothetical protein
MPNPGLQACNTGDTGDPAEVKLSRVKGATVSIGSNDVGLEQKHISSFVESYLPDYDGSLRIEAQPLTGGLCASTARIEAHYRSRAGADADFTFVVKRLQGTALREAQIYKVLSRRRGPKSGSPGTTFEAPLPRVLGTMRPEQGVCYLYLECVTPSHIWPWEDVETVDAVLHTLASIHIDIDHFEGPRLRSLLSRWDYDSELQVSAQSTLELLESLLLYRGAEMKAGGIHKRGRSLRRLVESLPEIRRCLRESTPLGLAVLHGDVHPGNILLCEIGANATPNRKRGSLSGQRVVLLDWERARLGSPLEDVSSWLQSLGYWEPEAKRRHDTLLRRYLRARGVPETLTRQVRDQYWLAAACNVLSGSLRYHLAVATGWGEPSPDQRAAAFRAAADCLRIIRRADACWRA